MKFFLGIVCLSIALFLFSLNITGLFFNFNYEPSTPKKIIPIASNSELKRQKNENSYDFVRRVVQSVHFSMEHYFILYEKELPWAEWRRTTIHYTDNYFLYLATYFNYLLGRGLYIEFEEPELAFKRGYGFCSQFALAASSIFGNEGYESKVIAGLTGHVMSIVKVDGMDFAIDADYNAVIPLGFDEITEHPDIIRQYYHTNAHSQPIGAEELAFLEKVYRQSGSHQKLTVKQYLYPKYRLLTVAAIAKWAIPFFLLVFGVYLIRPSKKRGAPQKLG